MSGINNDQNGGLGSGMKKVEIIPYHPSEIKIEKREGKKTAQSLFCTTRKPEAKPSKPRPDVAKIPTVEQKPLAVDDSDKSDVLSVVSDLSELSVMSFNSSNLHLTSSDVLPSVHGGLNRNLRKYRARNFAQEPDETTMKFCVVTHSSQKSVITKIKDENFELRRENVNLKSQVEALQVHQKYLSQTFKSEEKEKQSKFTNSQAGFREIEIQAQVRHANEELFKAQSSLESLKLEYKSVAQELNRVQAKCQRLNTKNVELEQLNKEYTSKQGDNQDRMDSNVTKIAEVEEEKQLLVKVVEGLKRTEQWYKEQLQNAQSMRKVAEQDLVKAKADLSAKNAEVEQLKVRLEEQVYCIDKEKRNLAQEKDGFALKLKSIETEMAEQEVQLDQIQKEKDSMILELSQKLNASESDISSFRTLGETLDSLQADLLDLKGRMDEKEQDIVKLKDEKDDLCIVGVKLQEELEKNQSKITDLEVENAKLLSNIEIARDLEQDMKIQMEKMQSSITEKSSLEHTQSLLLSQLEEQKNRVKVGEDREIKLVKKIRDLEQECLGQHNTLEEAQSSEAALKNLLAQTEQKVEELERETNKAAEEINKLASEKDKIKLQLKRAEEENVGLKLQIENLEQKVAESEGAQNYQDEALELRKRVLNLEQFENEAAELKQVNESLNASTSKLRDKLLETEKEYEQELDSLRSLVLERDAAIGIMKGEFESLEQDLVRSKGLLDSVDADRERLDSEKSRRLEDLEEALMDFDSNKKLLQEKQALLVQQESDLKSLQEENENLVQQLQHSLGRTESTEMENRHLKQQIEENIDSSEEMKEIHCQRISRLEHFITEYEKEIEELNISRNQLQNQIISLEIANGKLQSDSVLNESLREQVGQLQRDIKNDTSLREELAKSIEMAKASLGEEISSLDSLLIQERDCHAKTKEKIVSLEAEKLELRQDINSLQIKLNDKVEETANLERKVRNGPANHDSDTKDASVYKISILAREVKELEFLLEEKNRSMSTFEDHIATLKFHLQQKDSEIEELKKISLVQGEKYEALLERMKGEEENLRQEVGKMVKALEGLNEEKNNYKSQVQQMNLALRNSLEHIKQLRTQASPPASSSFNVESSFSSQQDSQGKNLNNLQTCLASLKAEMASLQKKLAPQGTSENVPSPSTPTWMTPPDGGSSPGTSDY